MNKTHIKTYNDLIAERDRLQALLAVQRQRVIDDWSAVKAELEPVNNVFSVVGKMASSDKSHPLMNLGLQFASDIFLKNFVLAKAGWVTRLAVPFMMKNYSSHLIAEKGRNLFVKLRNLFQSKKHRHYEPEPGSQPEDGSEY